ncbi:hypothetical protein LY13_004033 [Prauserella aidingensis]|uniref:hypothetical protein n=1 Tax=Prauserella aidingensis TaxID=387890 RepID=UPI0020A5B2D6|nr:hypothetical protein [Prauserella aidingensis]MCP2255259.1 hypothetical protein [Prauserella aidingensis]
MDLLIAATAHAHDAHLVTRNPDGFVALDGLVEVTTVRADVSPDGIVIAAAHRV